MLEAGFEPLEFLARRGPGLHGGQGGVVFGPQHRQVPLGRRPPFPDAPPQVDQRQAQLAPLPRLGYPGLELQAQRLGRAAQAALQIEVAADELGAVEAQLLQHPRGHAPEAEHGEVRGAPAGGAGAAGWGEGRG